MAEDAPCRAAVNAFAGALHCGLSGSMSLAVGPIGRQADATMQVRPCFQTLMPGMDTATEPARIWAVPDGTWLCTISLGITRT